MTSRHRLGSARTRIRVWAERVASHVHHTREFLCFHLYASCTPATTCTLPRIESCKNMEHSFQDFERRFAQRLVSDLLATDFQLFLCLESTTTSTEKSPDIQAPFLPRPLDHFVLDLWRSASPDAILIIRSAVIIRYFSSLLLLLLQPLLTNMF